jgi:hypothetical protein
LIRPNPAPTPSATRIATGIGTPDSKRAAAVAAESPIMEATERSISPLMITKAIARMTIAFSMPSWKRLTWLPTVMKFGTRVML